MILDYFLVFNLIESLIYLGISVFSAVCIIVRILYMDLCLKVRNYLRELIPNSCLVSRYVVVKNIVVCMCVCVYVCVSICVCEYVCVCVCV